ncbi:MAG: TonB C-terminal domain-containing protein [Acidobacteria bacterium]|nr:TonB C-terminal domain-containing protein [Acidobacteriota bacterium]
MSTTPPTEEQQQPRSSRYREMEHHELIHLLDEVDDDRARARFRESVYLSIIVWLVLLLVLRYGPHYLWKQPHVITEIRPEEQKQFTMLNLPPDMVKKIPRTKPAPQIAERDQAGQSPQPAPTPPQPAPGERSAPAPQQAAPQPQQQPQQQAHTQPPPPPQQRPQQAPLIDTPRPSPQQATRPNFNTGMSAGEQIRQAARDARGGATTQYGDYGNAPTKNGSQKMGTQILSDTQGVDFGKYLQRLLHDIKRNWDPLIPEECKPPILKQGITDIRFTINRDGSIAAMNLDMRSGDVAIDRSAWGAITSLGQAQPLPPEFRGPNLVLRIEFRVNKDMDVR